MPASLRARDRYRMAAMSITIWRRHTPACPHAEKGRAYLKCSCPLWADGYQNGRRTQRQSLGTRDLARARKKAADLDNPDEVKLEKPIKEAIKLFIASCRAHGSKPSSTKKYTGMLGQFEKYCDSKGLVNVRDLDVTLVDDYHIYRVVAPNTRKNDLTLLRGFFKYCVARKWLEENPAKDVPFPNVDPSEKVPYSKAEIEAIKSACFHIGHEEYERLRAYAMILTMRYTALRIGDIAMMKRDRIHWDEAAECWRIFVRTTKKGKQVFLPAPQELKDALDCNLSGTDKYFFWTEIGSAETMVGIANRVMRSVFKLSKVPGAHSHRFRHTLATELLGQGATDNEVADVLGNTPEMVRKYYGQWSPERQSRIDGLMKKVHASATYQPKRLVVVK
jgi:integrase